MTLANIITRSDAPFIEETVYDIRFGNNSILAASGHFAAALLGPAGIDRDDSVMGRAGCVDVPDKVDILCPFAVYEGNRSRSDLEGTMASTERPVEYECWTQVHGRLDRLVVHPRLGDVNMHIEIGVYDMEVRDDLFHQQRSVRERPMSRRRCDLSTDGKLTFDGSIVNVSERIVIRLMPAEPTLVRSTDFIVLMREIK